MRGRKTNNSTRVTHSVLRPDTSRILASRDFTPHVLHRWILCLPFVLLTCASPPLIVPELGTVAPDFILKDQHDAEFRLSQFRGENVLLFGFDKDSIDHGEIWLNLFLDRYAEGLRILPIANGSGLPFFARPFLKGKIKADLREAAAELKLSSLLLDWTGEVSRQYGMPLQRPTVVLIDRAGIIQLVHPLPQLTTEEVRGVFDRIDQHIQQ